MEGFYGITVEIAALPNNRGLTACGSADKILTPNVKLAATVLLFFYRLYFQIFVIIMSAAF